jgi:hypothetical protein
MRIHLKILMRASWRGTLGHNILPPAFAKSRGAWDPRGGPKSEIAKTIHAPQGTVNHVRIRSGPA